MLTQPASAASTPSSTALGALCSRAARHSDGHLAADAAERLQRAERVYAVGVAADAQPRSQLEASLARVKASLARATREKTLAEGPGKMSPIAEESAVEENAGPGGGGGGGGGSVTAAWLYSELLTLVPESEIRAACSVEDVVGLSSLLHDAIAKQLAAKAKVVGELAVTAVQAEQEARRASAAEAQASAEAVGARVLAAVAAEAEGEILKQRQQVEELWGRLEEADFELEETRLADEHQMLLVVESKTQAWSQVEKLRGELEAVAKDRANIESSVRQEAATEMQSILEATEERWQRVLETANRTAAEESSDAVGGERVLPSHWSQLDEHKLHVRDSRGVRATRLVPLDESDERCKVEAAAHVDGYCITRVERVQNAALFDLYRAKRAQMLAPHAEAGATGHCATGHRLRLAEERGMERRWLFHGTSQVTAGQIAEQGFNRSFAGKNATRYGR